jgi:hypothetical protein
MRRFDSRGSLTFVGCLAAFAFAGTVTAQPAPFCWTLSTSLVDPNANTLIPTGGVVHTYLWLHTTDTGEAPCVTGVAGAQFGLVGSSGGPVVLAIMPLGGVIISGTPACAQLALPGCPTGPVPVAQVVVLANPGNVCFTACSPDGSPPAMGTVDCVLPGLQPMTWTGLDVGGGPCAGGGFCTHGDSFGACCLPDGTCTLVGSACECLALGGTHQGVFSSCIGLDCEPVSTNPTTWGKTKAGYDD